MDHERRDCQWTPILKEFQGSISGSAAGKRIPIRESENGFAVLNRARAPEERQTGEIQGGGPARPTLPDTLC